MEENISRRQINRALVLCGGGAKGAYTFGCLKAFKERGIHFDAVAGTSVGALNALLWSTDSLTEGQKLWDEISFSTVYPVRFLNPKWYPKFFLRLLGGVVLFLNLIVNSLKGVPHPAHHINSLLFTIPLSIPSIINFLFAFVCFYNMNQGLLPNKGWYLYLLTILAFGFVGLVQLLFIQSIFESFKSAELYNLGFYMFGGLVFTIPILLIALGSYSEVYREFFNKMWSGFNTWSNEHWLHPPIFISLCFLIFFGVVNLNVYFPDFVLNVSESVLNKLGTFLDSTPLYKTIESILLSKTPNVPTFVTTASLNDVFDPERGFWGDHEIDNSGFGLIGSEGGRTISWSLRSSKIWIPHYIDITTLSPEKAAFYCVASAALPFGIVPSVKIDEKEFVDGGIIDNIPFYPFNEILPAKEIYIVLLENFKSDEDAQIKSKLRPDDWNELERLQTVAKLPSLPPEYSPKPKNITVKYNKTSELPKLVLFYPSKNASKKIGGFVNGTLRFESEYAKIIMELGKKETILKLNELNHKPKK